MLTKNIASGKSENACALKQGCQKSLLCVRISTTNRCLISHLLERWISISKLHVRYSFKICNRPYSHWIWLRALQTKKKYSVSTRTTSRTMWSIPWYSDATIFKHFVSTLFLSFYFSWFFFVALFITFFLIFVNFGLSASRRHCKTWM